MQKLRVPFFDLKRQYHEQRLTLENTLRDVLASCHFILGDRVEALERKIAELCGVEFAVGVASGSDALWLSLSALGVGPGDEVITTPYTFIATSTSILKVGARPVFVDIEPESFLIDNARIKEAISKKTRAVIPVHLFGRCVPMQELQQLAQKHELFIIEDAAQSLGASFKKNPAGSMGEVGCLSFYPTKNLGAAGDGGMIVTDQASIAKRIKILRGHGAAKKYFHEFLGWNSRLDEIQAAILLVKLKKFKKSIQARRRIAKQYQELLKDLPLKLPYEPKEFYHTYNQFVIHTRERGRLRRFLDKKGIGTEIYYPLPLHLQPCFSSLGYRPGDFPNAERAAQESLALPIYPELTERQVQFVVQVIRDFYKRHS
jgi:dTDP-4-amino-4,6-dideoxygalactose transaminase